MANFNFDPIYLFYLLVGVSAAMFAEGVYLLFYTKSSYRKNINRRLKVMDEKADRGSVLVQLRRERGLTAAGDYRLPMINLNQLVLQSGLTIGFTKLLFMVLAGAAIAFATAMMLTGSLPKAAGAALFAGALLGLIVGTVIVAQTLYSSTKDHLDEFATLRALGSSNAYIYRVIIYQALLSAIIGFCFAAAIGFVVVEVTTKGALPIVITPALIAAILALTVAMCVASALAAILRVLRIDPVMVFTR